VGLTDELGGFPAGGGLTNRLQPNRRVLGERGQQLVEKGSIAVDGVSLTVVDVLDDGFTVAVVPHTTAVTTLGTKQAGDRVNLEVDVTVKYVERLLAWKDV